MEELISSSPVDPAPVLSLPWGFSLSVQRKADARNPSSGDLSPPTNHRLPANEVTTVGCATTSSLRACKESGGEPRNRARRAIPFLGSGGFSDGIPPLHCIPGFTVVMHASRVMARTSQTSPFAPSRPESTAPSSPCSTAAGARRRRASRPRLVAIPCPTCSPSRVEHVDTNAELWRASNRRCRRSSLRRWPS